MRLAIILAVMTVTAMPALAGYPPIKIHLSREEIATKCEALGANGKGVGLDRLSGEYSCQNLATGNLVECKQDGTCTSYSGDPRVKRLNLTPLRRMIA